VVDLGALVPAGQAVTITRTLPHGHVAAVHAMAARLGLPALLGPAGPQRDLALALVISRVVAPDSKLATLTWRADTTLGGAARWPPAATPATARKARCRSSTGCSPTRPAARSRSGYSPGTPATRPRSPRSRAWCGTSSGWPRWSWSGTGA
jgi:hypothetical protein